MTDLNELATRCEQATGPDRELDRLIELEVAPENSERIDIPMPMFTASLDAAMTLIPVGLTWQVSTDYVPVLAGIFNGTDDDEGLPAYQGEAATPALALCAAALRARAFTTQSKETETA